MIYQETNPTAKFKDIIRCYWALSGDAGDGVDYIVTPDCCMDIIFNFTDEGVKGRIAGACDGYYRIMHTGRVFMVGVRFLPGAFFSNYSKSLLMSFIICWWILRLSGWE